VKIKSALATELSGSIGGMTASHNRGGYYLRARVIPSNPNTNPQAEVRSTLADLVAEWFTLTAAQRTAWTNYAEAVELPDKLGGTHVVSGLNMYIRTNTLSKQVLGTFNPTAPTIFNLGEGAAATFSVSAATQLISIAFDAGDAWCDEDGTALVIFASRPLNKTVNFFRGPYRYASNVPGSSSIPPTSPTTLSVPFPVVLAQRIGIRSRIIRADGRVTANQFNLVGVTT
jgi:hypothetical protein